jgi:nicotinamide riboside kinase
MANWVSAYYGFTLVKEVARNYLQHIGVQYSKHHVREIGILQQKEEELIPFGKNLTCDTDLLNIIIWQLEKYGKYDEDFYLTWQNSKVDMYFLCVPDMPWEADELRENPTDRDRLYNIYEERLTLFAKPYIKLSGNMEQRQSIIKQTMIENRLNISE